MKTVNSRNDEMCLFCKYWMGDQADIDYVSGKGKVRATENLCSYDGKKHISIKKCRHFERCLTYL